jgi:hypothetical protein
MFKKFYIALFLTIVIAVPAVFAGQTIGNWALTTDASGGVTSMALTNPATYLNIEASVIITVDNQGTPVHGTVKFRDGIERELTSQEVVYYWDLNNGAHAIWEYFASVNRVDLFNPDGALLPASMYGKFSRITTKAGVEYFGKLVEFSTNPDWFVIQVGGASVTMYRHAIAAIQQLK